MPQYDVSIVYEAEFWTHVEADSEESAGDIARQKFWASSIDDIISIRDTYVEES